MIKGLSDTGDMLHLAIRIFYFFYYQNTFAIQSSFHRLNITANIYFFWNRLTSMPYHATVSKTKLFSIFDLQK